MAKQQILLVDADSSSARLLEVSLRSAGFTVATAVSAEDALSKLEHGTPDLILTDTRLPGADGFAFVRKLRARTELGAVPVVFLSEQGALEDKLRGLELGVDDYLAKPIFVREVVTRVQLLLARKKQQRIAVEPTARTRFSGSLEDVAVVDVLQTIAVSGKSGVASVTRNERQAWLYFDRGQVIDAEVGDLRGEEAVYRVITWTTGSFDLEFKAIERERVIDAPHQALLMEGLRRVDELGRLSEQLPPENAVVDIDHEALAGRLNEIPDELNALLRLIDGKRTLLDLIDASPFDDLSTLTVLSKFYFEGLLSSGTPDPVEWAPGSRSSAPPAAEQAGVVRGSERVSATPITLVPPGGTPPPPLQYVAAQPSTTSPTQPPPSTVPGAVEPPREARRPTPVPARTTSLSAADTKLTPKGIVNIGGDSPPPSRAVHREDREHTPRRSPIPMPAGSPPRSSAFGGGQSSNGVHAGGLRETRTALGLSAKSLHDVPAPAEQAAKTPIAAEAKPRGDKPRDDGRASAASNQRPVAAGKTSATSGSAVTPGGASPASTAAAPGSAPGSNPEPEQKFFEAGDHGTYAGGPRSEPPEARLALDIDLGPAPRRRAPNPVHQARARRSLVIVVGILALAGAPLVVAAWRHLAARAEAPVAAEPAAPVLVESAPPAVVQPEALPAPGAELGATAQPSTSLAAAEPAPGAAGGPALADPGLAAEIQPAATPPAAAPTPAAATPAEPAPAAVAPAPVAAPAPVVAPAPARPAPPSAPPSPPRAVAPRARAATPKPPAPEAKPAAPFEAPPAPALPGQDPPAAAPAPPAAAAPPPPEAGPTPPAATPAPAPGVLPPPGPAPPPARVEKPKPPTAAFPAP